MNFQITSDMVEAELRRRTIVREIYELTGRFVAQIRTTLEHKKDTLTVEGLLDLVEALQICESILTGRELPEKDDDEE